MTGKVQCGTHGESSETFVCNHLQGDSFGLGFNCDEPTDETPFPDAWCNDCELIRATHNGWNKKSEALVKITLLCAGCYQRSRIRNTQTSLTPDDLANLRWKCSTCEEWHPGPCLDFAYDVPDYWQQECEKANRKARLLPSWSRKRPKTFLNEDFCAIEDADFFVRGIIHLPIVGTAETLRWGVWGSLSRETFEKLMNLDDDFARADLPPMFSWLSNWISESPIPEVSKCMPTFRKPDNVPTSNYN
jgi:hypothetical protein